MPSKALPYIIGIVLLVISSAAFWEVYRMSQHAVIVPSLQSLAAFDPQQNQVPGVAEINKRMKERIVDLKQHESSYRNWTIALNAGVTILTALAALIATITTVRAVTKKRSTILVAVFTFCATLLNYGQSHFSSEKEDAARKTELIKKWRLELENLSVEELPRQLDHYNNELDEL